MDMTFEEYEKRVREELWESVERNATEDGFGRFMQEEWVKETLVKRYGKLMECTTQDEIDRAIESVRIELWWDYGEKTE